MKVALLLLCQLSVALAQYGTPEPICDRSSCNVSLTHPIVVDAMKAINDLFKKVGYTKPRRAVGLVSLTSARTRIGWYVKIIIQVTDGKKKHMCYLNTKGKPVIAFLPDELKSKTTPRCLQWPPVQGL